MTHSLKAVHPRSRGEHVSVTCPGVRAFGSSPLARGTLHSTTSPIPAHRFIPARAGNTGASSRHPTPPAVHPRSRGEHSRPFSNQRTRDGSSPLARGTQARASLPFLLCRFIPARAGNTTVDTSTPDPHPVHPRSRGEHELTPKDSFFNIGSSPLARGTRRPSSISFARYGSSPLARGTQESKLPPCCQARFIPARAGNTT